jgi:hypothetical protein
MATGLAHVSTPTVLFIDADLSGLRAEHVTYLAVAPPVGGMLVGVRGKVLTGRIPSLLAMWPSISGERRMPTEFARSVHLNGVGWKAETLINVAAVRQHLPHSQVVMLGVANDAKKSAGKGMSEAVRVSAVTLTYAPELARYVWSEC